MSRAVAEIIDALALEDLTLIVHDLGGPAGIAGAARMARRVRGIVAVNAFGWRPTGTFFRGMLSLVGGSFFQEFDLLTDFVPRVTSSSFGIGRHMDKASRRAFRAGIGKKGINAFHSYMHDARDCEGLYTQVDDALTGPFRNLPLATIFGERNDPLGFQPRWKSLFPAAHQVVVARGNHFPMCDDPELVAETIREWHRERVAPNHR